MIAAGVECRNKVVSCVSADAHPSALVSHAVDGVNPNSTTTYGRTRTCNNNAHTAGEQSS